MIGRRVEFSINQGYLQTGVIIDKINMIDKSNNMTGYMIEDEDTGEIKPIHYWRIIRTLPPEPQLTPFIKQSKKGQ